MNFKEISEQIAQKLQTIHKFWDGKESILEMKEAGYPHWKQMEWIGFYFQFICEKNLRCFMDIPGPKYGNVQFDAFKHIPWDFKAHAMNTSSHQIIVNDSEATANGIRQYNAVGLILALGKVQYNDEDRKFQAWHESIKGKISEYTIHRIKRGAWSRIRKVSFELKQIAFIKIRDETLIKCGAFQQDFRNANGSPRRSKVLLDLEKIDEELEYCIEF
ncbi:MAG: hypothetical protein N3A62_04800 [Thermodesulfovibrionales bacterium]|nr:hypothetical protein [Thermodesulfovibrionales bacterium]